MYDQYSNNSHLTSRFLLLTVLFTSAGRVKLADFGLDWYHELYRLEGKDHRRLARRMSCQGGRTWDRSFAFQLGNMD